jgi:hypothetical protein
MLTMARRCFLNLMLKIGACICFDGRNQTASGSFRPAVVHDREETYKVKSNEVDRHKVPKLRVLT